MLAEVTMPQPSIITCWRRALWYRLRKNSLIFGDCLRITVGTPEENNRLIEALKNFKDQ